MVVVVVVVVAVWPRAACSYTDGRLLYPFSPMCSRCAARTSSHMGQKRNQKYSTLHQWTWMHDDKMF